MKITNLSFLIKEGEVLLAMKKRGFGVGKWNGVGGKVQEGETVEQATIREIKEEIGVDVSIEDLRPAATLNFDFEGNPDWKQVCYVFIIERWTGDPVESEEMRPEWYAIDKLPFEAMWVDDPYWVPQVLAGKKIKGIFLFDKMGGKMLDYKVV